MLRQLALSALVLAWILLPAGLSQAEKPLPPSALADAFPWPTPAVIELAALLGGTPGYVLRCDPGVSLERNLLQNVLTKGEPLYEEVPFLLREELREPRVYMAVLSAIAAGARKFGEISSKVGLDRYWRM